MNDIKVEVDLMDELITIIVPIYNVENYLQRCVNSILTQTYTNIEIILVNDGSPDNCGVICDEYSKIDSRIKVLHKDNGGLSDARNAGLEIAQGYYVTFIDSDDWISNEYVEKLHTLLKDSNADISICNFIKTSKEDFVNEDSEEIIYEYSNSQALMKFFDDFYVQMVIACGKLYKIKLFREINFPIGKLHEDEFTTYKLIYNADKVVLTTAQLYYYWQREDSIMGSGFNMNGRFDIVEAYLERADFFKEIGMDDASNKTYRSLFYICIDINRHLREVDDLNSEDKLNRIFTELRDVLRSSKQSIKFKIFYEFFYFTKNIPFIYKLSYFLQSRFSVLSK